MYLRNLGRWSASLMVMLGSVVVAPSVSAAPSPSIPAQAAAPFYQLPAAVDDGVPGRIGGASRYETAALIAHQFGRADAVIVANGSNVKGGFDALSANYLAGQLDAPIVLTSGSALEPVTANAVRDVLAGSATPAVYVMGKEDSVSASVATQLNAIAAAAAGTDGDYVHRIAGGSRYATSAQIATAAAGVAVGTVGFGSHAPLPTAILASGTANADALAAGPLSNAWGIPVLLTAAAALAPEISAAIGDLGIKQLLVLGGRDRISDAAVAQARAAGVVRVQRVAGANRFATAAQLYTQARTTLIGPDGQHYSHGVRAFIANGVSGFPDALAVGPLAARLDAPLLTVTADHADPTTLTYLDSAKEQLASITALGSTASVGYNPYIVAKSAIVVSLVTNSDGSVDPALDRTARFVAAAASLPTFAAKVQLAMTYLPGDVDTLIGTLHPRMKDGFEGDAVGLTDWDTCDMWLSDTMADAEILDTMAHEFIHVLQCRADAQGFDAGYSTSEDTTVVNGIERGADAGAYLLGFGDLWYVMWSDHAGPLQTSEIVIVRKLLDHFKIPYRIVA